MGIGMLRGAEGIQEMIDDAIAATLDHLTLTITTGQIEILKNTGQITLNDEDQGYEVKINFKE